MARFIKGDVVVLPFPFSDLSGNKRRPALVLTNLTGDDLLLCQITSQQNPDSIHLNINDFTLGSLFKDSFIRPTKLFTADKVIIVRKAGHINPKILNQVIDSVIKILKN